MEQPASMVSALFIKQQTLEGKDLLTNLNTLCTHDLITLDELIQVTKKFKKFSNPSCSQL